MYVARGQQTAPSGLRVRPGVFEVAPNGAERGERELASAAQQLAGDLSSDQDTDNNQDEQQQSQTRPPDTPTLC